VIIELSFFIYSMAMESGIEIRGVFGAQQSLYVMIFF
jgi:hypothetical protein